MTLDPYVDRFIHSWQVIAVAFWNKLPADLFLSGEKDSWKTILKDVQRLFNNNDCTPVCMYSVVEYEVHRSVL